MDMMLLVGGFGIASWGLVELVGTVRGGLPSYLAAQGVFFIELGLGFVVQATMPEGPVRTATAITLFSGALWTAVVQHKLMRAERSKKES